MKCDRPPSFRQCRPTPRQRCVHMKGSISWAVCPLCVCACPVLRQFSRLRTVLLDVFLCVSLVWMDHAIRLANRKRSSLARTSIPQRAWVLCFGVGVFCVFPRVPGSRAPARLLSRWEYDKSSQQRILRFWVFFNFQFWGRNTSMSENAPAQRHSCCCCCCCCHATLQDSRISIDHGTNSQSKR